jgi:hypothetical protein
MYQGALNGLYIGLPRNSAEEAYYQPGNQSARFAARLFIAPRSAQAHFTREARGNA